MIQILEESPSFAGEFARNIAGGASEGFMEAYGANREAKKAQQKLEEENKQFKKHFGIDLSGIESPEQRKAIVIEKLRQQGKEDLLKKRMTAAEKFLGGGGQQQRPSLINAPGIMSPEYLQQQQNAPQGDYEAEGTPDAKLIGLSLVDPQTARLAQSAKDTAVRQRQEEEKQRYKEKQEKRKEKIEFHKETAKYDEELLKNTKAAKNQLDTIKNIEKAINTGNITPSKLANVFKGLGRVGDKISDALLNADQAALQASIPQLFEGWKEVFGVRLSDADLKILQDKLPSIGKTPDANRAVMNIMRKYADMTLLRSQIAADIKQKNKGLRPLGYADQIEQRFDEMVSPVSIIYVAPNGQERTIDVPAYKLSDALKAGARLANEL